VERGELIAGRYDLVKRLGRGGMGEVWAARDRTLHRDVALKLLDLDGAVHPDLPQRFEREAVAAAQINHPNVVALYDRGIHEDLLFLVMEKVEGATLTEHIHAETPMSLASALELASGICSALVAAHRAHVIHYDIKPHNVMLTPDGQVKVVDFGIAGFIQTAFTLARSSELTPAGTPEYGAPEQFLTERGDERSDLYALGGVLFALLTGRPPFTGHHAMAIVRRKLDEDAPHLDSLRPELPPALSELVAELLDRDPTRRPASARQVHERLRHIWASVDATAPSPVSDVAAGPAVPEQVVAPTGPTRRLPEDPSPVDVSWTGKEPLSTYDRRLANQDWTGPAIVAAISALVALVCLLLASGRQIESPPGKHETTPGFVLLLVGVNAVISPPAGRFWRFTVSIPSIVCVCSKTKTGRAGRCT
jgi:serine/threonine protein kinase